jgi:hypothetical protein
LNLRVTILDAGSTDLMYNFLVSTSLKTHSKSFMSSLQTQFPSVYADKRRISALKSVTSMP